MPIDPSILLALKPPPQMPTIEERQISEANLALAQQKRQEIIDASADRAAITAAIQSSIGEDGQPDFNKALGLLARRPTAYNAFQAHLSTLRKQALDAEKVQNEVDEKDAQLLAQAAGSVGEDGSGYDWFRQRAVAIDPRADKFLKPQFDPQQLALVKAAGTGVKEQNDKARETTQLLLDGKIETAAGRILGVATSQQQWDQGLAELKVKTLGVPHASDLLAKYPKQFSPEAAAQAAQMAIAPEKREELAGQAASRAQTAANQAATRAQEQQRIGLEGQRVGMEGQRLGLERQRIGLESRRVAMEEAAKGGSGGGAVPGVAAIDPNAPHGDDYLKSIPNDAAMVKALAEGRQPWPSSFALRTPEWMKIIHEVMQYDPSFDTATINSNARAKVRQDFTSGKSADQIRAMNTAIGHLDQLSKLTDALKNRDMKLYNAIANSIMSNTTGWTGQTDFDTVSSRVAEEITRIWRGTGGSESDIQRDLGTLSSSRPPSQLHSAIGNLGSLIESQLQSLEERQKVGLGIGANIPVVSGQSRQTLQKLESKSGGAAAPSGGGTVPANVQKALGGQKPGRYTLSDGSVWIIGSNGAITKGGS